MLHICMGQKVKILHGGNQVIESGKPPKEGVGKYNLKEPRSWCPVTKIKMPYQTNKSEIG